MKKMTKTMIALAIAAFVAQPVFADDQIHDGSASAAAGFLSNVEKANGVVIRVPVNAQGEENTSEASLRLVEGATRASADLSTVVAAWNTGVDQNNVPAITDDSIQDGSTWGFNTYRYNYGWNPGYNYYYYQPYGYYYGNYYTYYNYYPTYYTSYGYRYYYWCN